jgi:small subunit ribosomal protein S5
VLECAGIHDVLSKSLGSSNAINIVHATVEALKGLEEPAAVAARRGLPLEDVAPASLLRAQAAGLADKAAKKADEKVGA